MVRIFRSELGDQCRLVLLGAEQLAQALKEHRPFAGDPTTRTWAALQGILVSAANISKLLWGSGNEKGRAKLEARRKPLRDQLGIADSSVLNSTRLRNDFEHFDERIEKWFGGPGSHTFVGRNIGPPDFLAMSDGREPPPKFGHFDPQTGIVEFWENSVNILEVIRAARELHQRLEGIIAERQRLIEHGGTGPAA